MASEGDHPFISPPCHVMFLGEGNIPRRLKALHEMLIAKGLEHRPIACDVVVEITEGHRLVPSLIRL
jgi:hypothetical protein